MKGCRLLSKEEINRLKIELSPRDLLLMMSELHFGLRVSEALALTFGDVAGDSLEVNSSKGSENVTFPLTPEFKAMVDTLRASYVEAGYDVTSDTHLFLSQKGGAISREYASQSFKAACKRANITGKVNNHSFRKNFVTAIYEMSGFDIALTKRYSRHKSLSNLDYYISTTNDTDLVKDLKW
jgi:integrase